MHRMIIKHGNGRDTGLSLSATTDAPNGWYSDDDGRVEGRYSDDDGRGRRDRVDGTGADPGALARWGRTRCRNIDAVGTAHAADTGETASAFHSAGTVDAVGSVDTAGTAETARTAGSVDPLPQVSSAMLREIVARHAELDVATLHFHLAQADETARAGCWHAAVNEARSFMEELIVGMAEYEAARRREVLSGLTPNVQARSGYHECRKYLVIVGLLDTDEMDLFKHLYAMASRKGSHPGVTEAAWGRLVCHLCWTAASFLLDRYAAWKSRRCRWPGGSADRVEPNGSPTTGAWRALPVRLGESVLHILRGWLPAR